MVVPELVSRAKQFAAKYERVLEEEPFGYGTDGAIWRTHLETAVKLLLRERNYRVERDCYQRLQLHGVSDVAGFEIPQIIGFDDELFAIEMSIVSPPFILDFGKAYLDRWPQHTPEVMEDWVEAQQELWEDRWPEVQSILWKLEQLGIKYTDPNPGNIMFAKRQKDC